MRMLRFTNRAGGREDDPVYISSEWIVAAYENHAEGGSLTTVIYGGPHGTEWNVAESLNEVIKIIEGVK